MIVNQLIFIGVSFPQRGLVRNSKKKEITVGMCRKNYIWRNRLVPTFSVALGSELIISFLRNLVFNFSQLIQFWLNIAWGNNICILKACVLRILTLYERFWNGNGVLKGKLWLNIGFCNSGYLLKLDFWPRFYMQEDMFLIIVQPYVSVLDSGYTFGGGAEHSESNFVILFFIF